MASKQKAAFDRLFSAYAITLGGNLFWQRLPVFQQRMGQGSGADDPGAYLLEAAVLIGNPQVKVKLVIPSLLQW
ncbi:hypothetical protein [Ferrimonas marina]|uniref:hypothetical protein n=1 Tax=Ferrimonas marina TaxID=299255 RepID=UPI00082DBC89|nr:hypothetical protein [Ferrimonas marina]